MYNNSFKIMLGKWPKNNNGVTEIFNKKKINFLNNISLNILNKKKLNSYPDLKSFAFWCREKNIKLLKKKNLFNNNSVGRGIALHIPPSNVPMSLAFTMALGLLSGCENIIRLPEKKWPQTEILLNVIKRLILSKKYSSLQKSLCFIKYKKDDLTSTYLSKISDVRLIWGGNKTVEKFKEYKTKIKNVDLYFPNKISGCLINTNQLKNLNNFNFNNLTHKFYNDSYTMDQKGCSSPKIIFWYGSNKKIIGKFYQNLRKFVKTNYINNFYNVSEKNYLLSSLAIDTNLKIKTNFNDTYLNVIEINKSPAQNLYSYLMYGIFFSIKIKNLNQIKEFIDSDFQTLTYYGFKKKHLIKFFIKNRFRGIDRVVPIGNAFEMDFVWDGYDVIKQMSRVIA